MPWPVNLLHIISRLPVGGVENQIKTLVARYDRKKIIPFVCSLTDKGEVGGEIEASGVDVFCLNKLRHTFDWTLVRDIYRLIKQKNITIVRTHQYHANFYGRIAAYLAKVPCIISSVHNVYTRDKKLHRRIMNHYLSKITDRVVAVSETVKKDIMKYDRISGDKISVIYNGIDADIFLNADGDAVRKEFGIEPSVPVIGTVGRLTFQKGQSYSIEAVSMILKKFPDTVLLLVGGGLMAEELKDYADTLGMHRRVIFTGSRKDVPDLLAAMDIFVFPSLWEGLPNALIEAMASGKPIIATDIPPVREIFSAGELGMIVPLKDSEALASALAELLADKACAGRIGKSAREYALRNFTITSTLEKYMEVFEETLEKKRWSR